MKQRYQMLLSSPLWIPIVTLTMVVVLIFNNKDSKDAVKELIEILKFAWRN